MNSRMTRTKTKVQFTVEVDGGQPWGDQAELGMMYRQAKESALNTIRNALGVGGQNEIRIIGEPKVIAVITEVDP